MSGLAPYGGISAYVGAAAVLGSVLLLPAARPGSFVVALSHVGGLVVFLAIIPVALGLYVRDRASAVAASVLGVGAAGALAGGVVQVLFLFHAIDPEQRAQLALTAFAVIGLWLVLASGPARRAGMQQWVALLGVAAGLAFVLASVAARLGAIPVGAISPGQAGPVVVVMGLLVAIATYVAYPIWMVAVGRTLRRRSV